MTPDELKTYRVAPEVFWEVLQVRGDDGYDRMGPARQRGWDAIPSWGRDGWDLGSWPLVVVYHRQSPNGWEMAVNVEGDVTCYRFPTRELLDEATDLEAFFYWHWAGEQWIEGAKTASEMPDHCRGPYSSRRAEAS